MTHSITSKITDRHYMIQISDTHLLERPEQTFIDIHPDLGFQGVLQDIQQHWPNADLLIHTGDMAQNPIPATYQYYQEQIKKLGLPFFQVPGNHDNPAYFPFHHPNPQQPVVVELGKWRVILLNSAVVSHIDGYFSDEQLSYLETLLEQYQDHFVVLACHHHPFAMHSEWIDQHKLKKTEKFLNILSKYNQIKLLLHGHVHQDSSHQFKHVCCVSTPSTCVQFKPLSDDFALDPIAPGYRVIELNNDGSFKVILQRLEHFNQKINIEISGY